MFDAVEAIIETDSPLTPETGELTKLTLGCWRYSRASTLLRHRVTLGLHNRINYPTYAHTLSHLQPPGHTAGLCSVSKNHKSKESSDLRKGNKREDTQARHRYGSVHTPYSWTRQSYEAVVHRCQNCPGKCLSSQTNKEPLRKRLFLLCGCD